MDDNLAFNLHNDLEDISEATAVTREQKLKMERFSVEKGNENIIYVS